MNRRNAVVLAAVVLVVVVAAALLFGHRSAPAQQAADPQAPSVPLATVRFGTFVSHVQAQGRIGNPAGGDAKLAFAAAGILARIDVHVGENVVPGQALAELDTSGLAIDAAQAAADARAASATYGGGSVPQQALASAQQKLATARAHLAALEHGAGTAQSDATAAQDALRQALAKVAADERTVQREQSLFAGGVAAQKDVEAARQQLALDRADADAARSKASSASAGIPQAVQQARADVAQAESDVRAAQAQTTVSGAQATSAQDRAAAAQRNLSNGVLRAPTAGVVVSILKHPGESVDPTQPAVVVGPPSSNAVTVTVSGDAAQTVRPGASATVSIPSRGLRGSAVVRSVVPSVDPTTQTSTVVLSGAPQGAASGDAVEAVIVASRRRGMLIPTDAIVEDPQTGHAVVFVRTKDAKGNDTFASREITVADGDATTSLVSSGLRAGERIAAHGAFDLLAPSGGGG